MTIRELRQTLTEISNQKMTVKELRAILFEQVNQDKELDDMDLFRMTCERTRTVQQYKEIRKIHSSDLRALCIRQNWYTNGDNEEYDHLLFDLAQNKENLSTADIIEIAADIMAHSNLDEDHNIESVAFEVARIADVFFEEV